MKRKILYALATAVIGMAAFSIGKFTTATPEPETIQAETKVLELIEMTVENGNLFLEYSDGNNFYSYWIPAEDVEEAGLIDPAEIVDWNTDGEELAFMTETSDRIGYEWYSYHSKDTYTYRNFMPIERTLRK